MISKRSSFRASKIGAPVVALSMGLGLAACSSSGNDVNAIAITATDKACTVAETNLKAGKTTFVVANTGGDVTEVYVYGAEDRIVGERENIGPGTKATLDVDLVAGDYEVACKPGQKGDGIRQAIKVTGEGGTAQKATDRQVEVTAKDYDFRGMEGFSAKAGETVEFELRNDGAVKHEFEVLKPDGDALGEVGPTDGGAEGKVTLTFDKAGTYRFVCGIDDHEARGMKGSFTVT